MTSSILRRAAYGAALFLVSAAALVVEIVAGRLLAPYVGMSLYTWTAIISVVLAGLTIGHWVGGRQAEAPHARRRVGAALLAAAACTALVLPLLRWAAGPLLGQGWHPIAAIVTLAATLFLPPSLFAGIISPVLTKLAIDVDRDHAGRTIGRMYALGAGGSILGTLSAGYLFLSWIGSAGTMLAVTVLYAVLGLAFLADSRRLVAIALGLSLAGGTALAVWGGAAFASPCRVESDYYCLRVEDFSSQSGRPSAVLVLDHLGHGINDAAQPEVLHSSYLHFTDELAARRFGRESIAAFFIGGGAYTLPRAWSSAYARPDLHVAEIDPAVTDTAHRHLWLEPDARGIVVDHRDARLALQSLPRQPRFDVVFGDAFHDIGIPPHLVTAEFHAEIAARLKPGGFYALNVIEARHEPRFLFALLKTLWRDFPAVEVWVDGDDLSQGERLTYLVLASDRPSGTGLVRASRFFPRHWLRLRDDQVRAAVGAAEVPLLTDDFAPVDRLMAHVLLSPDVGEK
jgi:spermidine synthase